MPKLVALILVVMVVYSAALIGIECATSQDYVRHFVTDIEGPVPFYAVNTTLSVFLLWGAALLFAVCAVCCRDRPQWRRLRWFFLSQVAIFAWLGIDDRFKFHEFAARHLGIGDHYVLLAVGVFEVAFLLLLGGRDILRRPYSYYLAAAVTLFGVMLVFDALLPHDMLLRLTLEDLAKTWANLCFFGFAWLLCRDRIDNLRPLADPSSGSAASC